MFQRAGVPESLLRLGGGPQGQRPQRGQYFGYSQDPLIHTILDQVYPHWQQHVQSGGEGGPEAFGKLLEQYVQRAFPPDEHPYDSVMRMLKETGNPHDVNDDDYHLREAKRTA